MKSDKELPKLKPYEPPHNKYIRIAVMMVLILLVITVLIVSVLLIVRGRKEKIQEENHGNESTSITDQSFLSEISTSQGLSISNPDVIPEYNGEIYVPLNNNIPGFTQYEIQNTIGEHYSELDKLGRCGTAYAMIDVSLMPTEERGGIGQVKPSGWNQEKYPGIVDSDPPYLYNRCHLLAYSLTGENANENNLITGTRYFNTYGMLPFEMQVLDYVRDTGKKVLYRVTPLFIGRELVARGVEMEAYSVEDNGTDVSYHVFVYNIQPGIDIDYQTGKSKLAE